jgi:hypothetical protein
MPPAGATRAPAGQVIYGLSALGTDSTETAGPLRRSRRAAAKRWRKAHTGLPGGLRPAFVPGSGMQMRNRSVVGLLHPGETQQPASRSAR